MKGEAVGAAVAKLRALLARPEVKAGIARQADERASWRYGTAADDPIVEIAEELRRVRLIDTGKLAEGAPGTLLAEIRKEQSGELSRWLGRVKRAADEGDADFFENVAKALRLIEAKPSAARDAEYFALGVLRDFRRAGIEPTRADIRETVERILSAIGGRTSGDPSWKRIFRHPELAGLRQRRRGEEPQRLPEGWE